MKYKIRNGTAPPPAEPERLHHRRKRNGSITGVLSLYNTTTLQHSLFFYFVSSSRINQPSSPALLGCSSNARLFGTASAAPLLQRAMSEHPLRSLLQTFEKVSSCIQTHILQFIDNPNGKKPQQITKTDSVLPLFSLSSSSHPKPSTSNQNSANFALLEPGEVLQRNDKVNGPITKEVLGRATWTLLHTLAAQYPDTPTRQQKKDVKELMTILSRIYPCKECADHFKEVLRTNPVQSGSHEEFSQWLCHTHNIVNRSLGKASFPCQRVDARWGKLECEHRACDLQGATNIGGEIFK